ncbi:unnamed protein product [Miscanthus lutarioriparius]|uniref:Uncharacterized protein n=1 Tax=Miscanthus lutarioriparius TaxID=422564 RepID=A0A811MWK0_9POAL|nr:unnamed protein product [Miscanthus lutarioriparius]
MALVDAKAAVVSTSTVAAAPGTADHLFLVVLDGVETPIHEGTTLYGSAGGTVTVTGPGQLSADGLRSVLVRGGGGSGTAVRFTLCADAAAEGVGAASFDRCGAARVEGAREVSMSRCRAAEVERAGRVTLDRCRDARLRGGGALHAARCRRADVESFGGVRLARCRAASADWCGTVEVELCRAVDVTRCGAVTGERCRVVNAAGQRRIPHAVFDAALHTEGASSLVLHKARKVFADPDAAACFPHQISVTDNEENDEARAAAAVADLKRLLDLEWANLPPSALERAADRIAGDGAHQTWAAADHTKRAKRRLLVGESTEREILSKLVQDGSTSRQPILTEVADNASNANEADGARRDDEAHSSNENSEADRGQEGAEGQVSEKSVPASKKCSLMERNPNASIYEWDSSDDDQPVRKCKLHPNERKSHPSPTCPHKIRKKWSEIEEKTLLEGVEKYGKGNWKDIKLAYPDVFEERSTVDLKDKFRNLERHHHESA